MEPILRRDIPECNEFVHQIKWDGIRGLSYIENGRARIFTKKGRERTDFYPELQRLPTLLKGKNAVLDGEIIILNEQMRPSFQLSLVRERVSNPERISYYARKHPVLYIVFDLLLFDNHRILDKPLHERGSLLREKLRTNSVISITDDFTDGVALFSLMKEKGWEGIVSKDLSSPYLAGKTHDDWFKTKLSRKILAIVIGLTIKEGHPNALVLAIWGEEGLAPIGRASIGLNQEHFRILKDHILTLKAEKNPLPGNKGSSKKLKDVVWLNPRLTVWISFLEWTSEGGLRHPKILGFASLSPEEANGKEFVE